MFERMHPAVNFIFFALVIGITVSTMNPYIIGTSLVTSFVLEIILKGKMALKQNGFIIVAVVVFAVIIQPLFSHNGVTPLFYINSNAVTLESVVYGFAMAVMLISTIQWCTCMSVIIDSDKYMYLFGNITPTLSLLISMTLRYIPLLRRRYAQIKSAQQGFLKKRTIKQIIKELSVLISWSLEESIETSLSMEARGYGMKRRTTYSTYRFRLKDGLYVTGMLILAAIAIAVMAGGHVSAWYLPIIIINTDSVGMAGICSYVLLAITPAVLEIVERGIKYGTA